jgi:hypothetical protein
MVGQRPADENEIRKLEEELESRQSEASEAEIKKLLEDADDNSSQEEHKNDE